jgi:hypothetical protein
MLVAGEQLTARQSALVLAAFPYRWTHENPDRQRFWSAMKSGPPTIPPVSDVQRLREHAFHFVNNGSRLSCRHQHCEPHYPANRRLTTSHTYSGD